MRFPKYLEKGQTIGLIAPSYGCTFEPYISALNNAEENFKKAGYNVVEGPNARVDKGIGKSNTPKACADEINDFFINNKSDVIISVGGGELMCEDLSFVDFEGIKKADPKWYMGFSDNTNLTFLLPTLCDIAAIYGPCASSYGMEPWHPSVKDAVDVITGQTNTVHNYNGWEANQAKSPETPLAAYNITEAYNQILYSPNGEKEVSFEGRLIGGCLDILVTLCGTKFDKVKEFNEKYKEDGIIWFVEACDLNVMSMRRAVWQLKEAGWFKYVKGFLVGRPVHYDDDFLGFKPHEAFAGVLEEFGVPVLYDLDIGHMSPMMPLIVGSKATVKATDKEIEITMGN